MKGILSLEFFRQKCLLSFQTKLVLVTFLHSASVQSVKLSQSQLHLESEANFGQLSMESEAMSQIFLHPFFFFSQANIPILHCFTVHYALDPSNSLFRSVRGMDGNIRFQFQGRASLFSKGSTPERNTLILGRVEYWPKGHQPQF